MPDMETPPPEGARGASGDARLGEADNPKITLPPLKLQAQFPDERRRRADRLGRFLRAGRRA